GRAEQAVGFDVELLLHAGAGQDRRGLDGLRHAERELAEARGREETRGREQRQASIHFAHSGSHRAAVGGRTRLSPGQRQSIDATSTGSEMSLSVTVRFSLGYGFPAESRVAAL